MATHTEPTPASTQNWIAAVRGFLAPDTALEHCELCGRALGTAHAHLIEPQSRELLCACASCAGAAAGSADSAWRRVPEDVHGLTDFRISDAQWNALLIPIGLAFFSTVRAPDA